MCKMEGGGGYSPPRSATEVVPMFVVICDCRYRVTCCTLCDLQLL